MKYNIFISYSRKNRENAEFITKRLTLPTYNIFWDSELPIGFEWWDQILKMILGSEIFIALISDKWLTSSYCQAEYNFALNTNRHILPVVLDKDFNVNKLNKKLRDLQVINFSDKDLSPIREWIARHGTIPKMPGNFVELRPEMPEDEMYNLTYEVNLKSLDYDKIQELIALARRLARIDEYRDEVFTAIKQLRVNHALDKNQHADIQEIIEIHSDNIKKEPLSYHPITESISANAIVELIKAYIKEPSEYYALARDLTHLFQKINAELFRNFCKMYKLTGSDLDEIVVEIINTPNKLVNIIDSYNEEYQEITQGVYVICKEFIIKSTYKKNNSKILKPVNF